MGHDWFMLHLSVARERWSRLSKPIHNCWQRLLLFLFYFWNKELENFLPKIHSIHFSSTNTNIFFFTKFVFFRLKFRSMHIIMHFLYFINYTKTLYITLPLCSQDHHNNSILFLSRIYQWCSIPRLHIQHDTR